MGMSQLVQRPRRKGQYSQMFNDGLSTVEDGDFISTTTIVVRPNEVSAGWMFPYPIVMERFWMNIVGNSLDGASINTLTLRIGGVDTTKILTLTDASPVDEAIEASAGDIAIPADTVIVLRWNSDSVGTCTCRGWGMIWRAVGA